MRLRSHGTCSRSVPLVGGLVSEEGGERAAGLVGGEEFPHALLSNGYDVRPRAAGDGAPLRRLRYRVRARKPSLRASQSGERGTQVVGASSAVIRGKRFAERKARARQLTPQASGAGVIPEPRGIHVSELHVPVVPTPSKWIEATLNRAPRRAFARAGALVVLSKPRLRGVSHQWACLCSVPLGVALVVAAGSERARIAETVYAVTLVALFWGERSVSPGRLAVAGRVAVDAPAGPFNDLHADRGHLHAACPARSPRAVGHRDPDRGVGGGAGRRRVQARVDRRPTWRFAVAYIAAGLGRGRGRHPARSRDRWRRLDAARARRRALHGGCRRLCGEAPGPGARGVRMPRGVPRPGHRCGRGPVRGDRVLGRAPLRTQPNREPARDAPARIHPPSVTLTTRP